MGEKERSESSSENVLETRRVLKRTSLRRLHPGLSSVLGFWNFLKKMVINVRKKSWAEFLRPISMGADFRVIS